MKTDGSRLIHLAEEAEGETPATEAHLFVTLTGTRLFSGGAAVREAAEVRQLVEAFRGAGARDEDVTIENVTLQTTKGLVTRSSSATIRLRARCRNLTAFPAFLDVLADAKNVQLTGTQWVYANEEGARLTCLRRCIAQARAKAEAVADELGVALDGVASLEERPSVTEVRPPAMAAPVGPPMAMRARVATELEGLDLAPSRKVRVRIAVVYRMGDPSDERRA
jgi:uncharacterized protein YggE